MLLRAKSSPLMSVLVLLLIYSKISMKNKIKELKNPYVNQYVAPYGYHFMRSGINYGRIAWFSSVDGVTIEKDET